MAPVDPYHEFTTDDWDLLVADIRQRNVVPVLGADLLIRGTDSGETFYQYLARELINRLSIDVGDYSKPPSLLELCSRYQSRALFDMLLKLIQAKDWPMPEPLKQLAEIEAFDLYVSTTLDSLLFDALRSQRVGAVHNVYGLRRAARDIEVDRFGQILSPTVFQIFGKLDGAMDCALSEEQILQFMQRIQDPEPAHRPRFLFDTLANRNLLFLGCDFPGWLGRFLRGILKVSGDLQDRGHFVHPVFRQDRAYGSFLERQGVKLWSADGGVTFVRELCSRWDKQRQPGNPARVFLSYAHNDGDVAKELADLFRQSGIPVWLDLEKLRSGEIWNDSIIAAIQASQVFVPVISRHSARSQPRYCHKEWDLAAGMLGKRICPLQTDLTQIPDEFASRQVRTLDQKRDLVRDVKEFLNQLDK